MKQQQEQQVKELSEELAQHRYCCTSEVETQWCFLTDNERQYMINQSLPLAQHLISKGWRKAGELTVISEVKFKEITDNVARDMGTTWEDIFEGSLEGRELEKYVIKVINKAIQVPSVTTIGRLNNGY